jgi:hypothetical protein
MDAIEAFCNSVETEFPSGVPVRLARDVGRSTDGDAGATLGERQGDRQTRAELGELSLQE